jgi:metallo-beta-lactamase class B
MKKIAIAAIFLLCAGAAQAKPFDDARPIWNQPRAPFRVIDNIYYVGTHGIAVFLIVTPQGDILTDGGLPESTAMIEQNIRALGFNIRDVKILLNSHAHFDHAGGLARLKADSGAQLYASAADTPILQSGHIDFGPCAEVDFAPVTVDHVIAEGSKVSLGGVVLTAHLTPGHTPGATTWTMTAHDGSGPHMVMFFSSITTAGNPLVNNTAWPGIADAYRATFAKMKTMKADVFLAPHGEQFDLDARLAQRTPGGPNPFIDPNELPKVMAQMQATFEDELAKQQAAKGR